MSTATDPSGCEVRYEAAGAGDPVLLVHGLTDSGATCGPVAERLTATHRVVIVDLPGHGHSEAAPSYGVQDLAAAVTAVLDAEGLDQPAAVGHSLGGVVVSVLAALGRASSVVDVDQSLALGDFQALLQGVEPALRDPEQFPETIAAILDGLDGPLLSEADRRFVAAHRRIDQEVVLGVWGTVLETPSDELAALVDSTVTAIEGPFLSLHGSDPGDAYAAWLHERVPHAKVEVWPDHGHYLHLVDPDRFTARLREFWGD